MTITITGKNSYQRVKELTSRIDAFVKEHGDIALEKHDGEETTYDRIRESLESLPFLATKKMVVLRSPSAQKEFTEHAERLIHELPDTTELIVYEPQLDKRTSYAKFLAKHTEFLEFKELDEQGLISWLIEESDNKLPRDAAQLLVSKIGPHQQMLASELQKLLSTGKDIDKKLVDSMVESLPQSSTFDLLEAAFAGNKKRVLQLYGDQRQQNVEPQAIIGLLSWQLHVLAVCVAAPSADSRAIAKDAKLNPYVVTKTLRIAQKLEKRDVKKYLQDLIELDHKMKTSAINADDALQAYLLSL